MVHSDPNLITLAMVGSAVAVLVSKLSPGVLTALAESRGSPAGAFLVCKQNSARQRPKLNNLIYIYITQLPRL